MDKINLRAYQRHIDRLIEEEQYAEAIAHCRHILETFPKHVGTYRLLGKAYLEAERYPQAIDLFRRVLAAVPDDFIAHAALSVAHEALDDDQTALWHMTRAFEVQPANPAIQEELRRLYEKAEGLAPPRLRLTRGALARMYVRNGLYAQAVGELRAALAKEPHRADLMALLAEALYRDGQMAEAANTAATLLRKLPYCYQANQILAEILEKEDRAEEAQKYRRRLAALDPYEAYRTPEMLSVAQVPDDAVMLEQLLWSPDMAEAAFGIEEPLQAEGVEDEALPTWFEEQPAAASEAPMESKAAAAESAPVAEAEPDETLAEAELPDWLQEIAPPEIAQQEEPAAAAPEATDEEAYDEDLAALLAAAGGEEGPPEASFEEPLPDWLAGAAAEVETPAAKAAETAEAPAEEEALPDWLAGAAAEAEAPEAAAEPAEAPAEEEALPDWLAGAAAEAQAAEAATEPAEAPASEEALSERLAGAVVETDAPAAEAGESAEAVEQPEALLSATTAAEPVAETTLPQASSPSSTTTEPLALARQALQAGDLQTALKHYTALIRRRRALDQIIPDLERAVARFPMDVDLFQALGDAYMRAGRLTEALDAYTKAEALLR